MNLPGIIDYEAEATYHAFRVRASDPATNPVLEAQLAFTFAALALLETLKPSEES